MYRECWGLRTYLDLPDDVVDPAQSSEDSATNRSSSNESGGGSFPCTASRGCCGGGSDSRRVAALYGFPPVFSPLQPSSPLLLSLSCADKATCLRSTDLPPPFLLPRPTSPPGGVEPSTPASVSSPADPYPPSSGLLLLPLVSRCFALHLSPRRPSCPSSLSLRLFECPSPLRLFSSLREADFLAALCLASAVGWGFMYPVASASSRTCSAPSPPTLKTHLRHQGAVVSDGGEGT